MLPISLPFTCKPSYFTGSLTCYVRIEHSGVDSTVSSPLNVLALPTTHLDPMTATVVRGNQLNLTCMASLKETGHPGEDVPPVIQWYRNGTVIEPSGRCFVIKYY